MHLEEKTYKKDEYVFLKYLGYFESKTMGSSKFPLFVDVTDNYVFGYDYLSANISLNDFIFGHCYIFKFTDDSYINFMELNHLEDYGYNRYNIELPFKCSFYDIGHGVITANQTHIIRRLEVQYYSKHKK